MQLEPPIFPDARASVCPSGSKDGGNCYGKGEWWIEPSVRVILALTGLLALWVQNENSPSLDFRRRQQKLVQSNRCKTGPGKAAAGRPVASVA
jgi:hypothetical protein